ncbi:MAG: glycosyltransferase family 2 protein [Elusimicrobiota bacterium]|jgi:glycosyltransferase involved in cell wall biosynthesis|nr:glycosyltransferase family 2 protein [Elusimicrobiota bacterium]
MQKELSVFLITKQEGKNLDACLASVKDLAGEIVIVDSGSTDDTLEIAKKYGAIIYHKDFTSFTEQKNFALEKTTKTWSLNLDADETLTPALAREIEDTLKNPKYDAYELLRSSVFLGRHMKHGGMAKEKCLRLVKKSKAKYVGGRVHERLEVVGEIGLLKNIFMHNTYISIEQYFAKFNHYTSLAAQTMYENKKKFNPLKLLASPFYFSKIYLFKFGFLDGIEGFLWALFSSFYPVVKYAKLWDLQRKDK